MTTAMIKPWNLTIRMLLSSVIVGVALHSHAEVATATAQHNPSDAVVIGQIIQQHQAEDQAVATADSTQPYTPRTAETGEERTVQLPALNAPVIDPMNLLSASEKEAITQKSLQIYQSGKAQIGVVFVPSTGQQDIFSYSLKIAEDWGLGSEKYDNGLLIVVAKNDRRIQILTGYGLEGVLPDIVVNRIIRNQITPEFKAEQYGSGVMKGLNEIERILNLDPEIARQAAEQLKEQQEQAQKEAEARETSLMRAFIILMIAVFASAIVGRKVAGVGAGVAGVASGLIAGSGLIMSLMMGVVLFVLIISSVAQGLTQVVMSSRGGGGGRGGGFGGGGGFSGGGGGFGGGGASGSW